MITTSTWARGGVNHRGRSRTRSRTSTRTRTRG
jgi:hypothetical protein